ncbi:CHAT domain-containing protein [Sphaerospermopsis aphanizomenoides BCCUSP55]|nr:CHAT domain-containing protein [Sphaerospermopsis aphanizomenoides BCCUSP55]
MQRLLLAKRVVKFSALYVLLFTLTFTLTVTPLSFAKQPHTHSAGTIGIEPRSPIHNHNSQFTAITPQQLLEQGEALYQAGNLTEAVTILQQANSIYQQRKDTLGQAAALSNLCLVYQQLGSLKEASEAISSSLNLLGWDEKKQQLQIKTAKPEWLEVLAQSLDIQTTLQLAQGKADISVETAQKAEAIWQHLSNNTGVTRSLINQAQAWRISGFYRRAAQILESREKQLKEEQNSPLKAAALRSLGNAWQQLGELDKSQETLQLSLEIVKRLQLSSEISITEFSLGNTERALGDIKGAIAHYQQAAAIATQPLTKVQAQINLLSLLVENKNLVENNFIENENPVENNFNENKNLGENKDIAEAKRLIPEIQSQLATLPSNQASIYASINFADTIIKTVNKKNTIINPVNKEDIAQILANSIKQAKAIGNKRAESYGLGILGKLYEQNNQWQEAQNLTQQALLIAQGINASDIAYLWQWQLGRLLKVQGDIQGAIAAYDAAVSTLQSLRRDLVSVNQQVQFNFRDSIEPIYRQSVQLLLQESGQGKPNLDKVRQRIEALQIAELDNFFREACLNNQFVVLDEIVDRDNPDTAIFYPIILDNKLEVVLKLPKQPLIHISPQNNCSSQNNCENIEQVITKMREAIVQPDQEKAFKKQSQKLYNWLIKPVEAELKKSGVTTLVFIPDGSLRNIPMSALYDGKEYLVQKYAVALSPGLQLFTPKPLAQGKINTLAGGLVQPPKNEDFTPLPHVKEELNLMQNLGVTSNVLLDQDFTKKNLEQKINLQPFRVVHLATHGKFSSKAEETFILAANERIYVKELDGLLKTREQNRTEPIELLVLSACETAAGDNRAVLGLAGVAIRAGARSTLASLWQIGDNSTALFIGEFYRQLTTGNTTAEALRLAQLKLLNDSVYNRPMYWAPYVLVGNWL